MFIRIEVFCDTDFREMKEYQPFYFTNIRDIEIYNHHSKDDTFPTKLITFNVNHIVDVIPIKYHGRYTANDSCNGFLIIDVNNNQFVSPVQNLDKSLMELNTQQVGMFTYDTNK